MADGLYLYSGLGAEDGDVLYPKVQAVYEEYAEKYGWGEVTPIKFQTCVTSAHMGPNDLIH